jgi:4'-phosphopantetheinyl transferase
MHACAGARNVETAAMSVVKLWTARPEETAQLPSLVGLLTDDERAAQKRLLRPCHQHEYFVTRVLARVAIGEHLAAAPASLRFRRTEHGRPELLGETRLHFNLSNTAGLVVCLVSQTSEVGVDVEALARGETILGLADTVFSHAERADLQSLEPSLRSRYAVALWTLKESYIKARGKGFALPLDAFAFRIGPPIELTLEPRLVDRAERWAFRTFEIGEHLVSTCVERTDTKEIRFLAIELRDHMHTGRPE